MTHLSYIGITDTAPSSMRVRIPSSMSVREHRGRNQDGAWDFGEFCVIWRCAGLG